MNQKEIIELHTEAIIARRKIVNTVRPHYRLAEFPDNIKTDLAQADRQISLLGQIHNARISRKSALALDLQ